MIEMNELKRIDPVSTGKIFGVVMAIVGFFIGLFVTGMSLIFSAIMPSMISQLEAAGATGVSSVPMATIMPMFGLVGAIAIVAVPVIYGIAGFVWGAGCAGLYNLVAGKIGGVKIEFG
jgi:hypothetical protein